MNPRHTAIILATAFLSLGVYEAAIADPRLMMGGGVYHVTQDRSGLNEANYLLAGSYGPAYAGTFVNSQGDRSGTLGLVGRAGNDRIEFSMYAGGVVGYRDGISGLPCTYRGACAYIAPAAQWWVSDSVSVKVILFGDALAYGLEVRL